MPRSREKEVLVEVRINPRVSLVGGTMPRRNFPLECYTGPGSFSLRVTEDSSASGCRINIPRCRRYREAREGTFLHNEERGKVKNCRREYAGIRGADRHWLAFAPLPRGMLLEPRQRRTVGKSAGVIALEIRIMRT
jgi:hypothetical protein